MTNSVALCRLAASTRPIAALALISCLSISRAATTDPACGNSRGTGPATPCVIHSAPSEYNERVLVVDSGIYRAMRFDSIDSRDQSRIRPGHPEELPMPYLRSAAVGLVVPPTLEHLLVIGLGGGAFPRFVASLFPDVAVDAVEIDPVVATVARDYFGVAENDRLRIHVTDAVEYVKRRPTPYDYILLDAYGADDLPASLTSSIFLGRVRDQLAEEGVLAVNIAVGSDFRARALIEKIRAFFSHCLRMQSLPSRNDVLLLSDTPLPGHSELLSRATRVDVEGDPGFGMRDHIAAAQPCQSPPD